MFKGLKKLIRLVVAVFLIYVLYMVVLFLFPVKYSDVVEEYEPTVVRQVISEETSKTMCKILYNQKSWW